MTESADAVARPYATSALIPTRGLALLDVPQPCPRAVGLDEDLRHPETLHRAAARLSPPWLLPWPVPLHAALRAWFLKRPFKIPSKMQVQQFAQIAVKALRHRVRRAFTWRNRPQAKGRRARRKGHGMSTEALKDLVGNGYLDSSVIGEYDRHCEPSWWQEEDAYRSVADPWPDIDDSRL